MRLRPLALCLVLASAAPASAQDLAHALIGTWRVTSYAQIDAQTGKPDYPVGEHTLGYVQIAPRHITVLITAADRKQPKVPYSEADRAAMFLDIGSAYVGSYKLEGDKMTVHEYTAIRPDNVNTDQVRFVAIKGNTLTLKNAPSRNSRTGKSTIALVTAERED